MEPPMNIHKGSGFRLETKNLIISALEEELARIETSLDPTPFKVRKISGVRGYSEIPEIAKGDSAGSYVYLVQTKDRTGRSISEQGYAKAREWFDGFDTVLAITQNRIHDEDMTGVFKVKVYGNYIGAFQSEE